MGHILFSLYNELLHNYKITVSTTNGQKKGYFTFIHSIVFLRLPIKNHNTWNATSFSDQVVFQVNERFSDKFNKTFLQLWSGYVLLHFLSNECKKSSLLHSSKVKHSLTSSGYDFVYVKIGFQFAFRMKKIIFFFWNFVEIKVIPNNDSVYIWSESLLQ